MKTFRIKRIALLFSVIIGLIACQKENVFIIEGNITGAKGSTLYLERLGYNAISPVDSVKLNEKGSFKFKKERLSSPDFFRLRLDKQSINLAIDSTETLAIQADSTDFATGYTIEGSEDCKKIKELTLLQIKINREYNKLQKSQRSNEISDEEFEARLTTTIEEYKTPAKKYILQNPKSTTAYFALLQQINNLLIFDPYLKEEYQLFAAVATAWNQYYPDSEYSKHIYNLTIQALKVIRGERAAESVEYSEVNALDYFDIALPNINGDTVKLSEINKKLILLDFTAYTVENSPAHNILLAEVYEKYKGNGLEIFQVSLDNDEHFWKNAAANLPWICVRDPQAIYSQFAAIYNVKEIPTGFLLNEGEIVKRLDTDKDIEKEINKYLK